MLYSFPFSLYIRNMEERKERLFWLGFAVFPGIGPARFQTLLNYFGSAENAWKASLIEIEQSGIGKMLAANFNTFRKTFSLEDYLQKLAAKQVGFVTLEDKNYPELLKKIKNPPFVLFIKGNHEILNQVRDNTKYIGIVGTRKITSYGRQVTESITGDLVQAGCIIVSGLALGVDALAHKTTLEQKGQTIAVLGCGVDCCSPRENLAIYNSIIASGSLIVSEYALGVSPSTGSFPSRNRIIAGLTHGIVVTEGAEDSGALITARDALENGRAVFAVPGPITSSLSKGPHALLANGAKLITSGRDILNELGIMNQELRERNKPEVKGDSADEQKIIDLLCIEERDFDEIVKKTAFDPAKAGMLLSLMEMKGTVRLLEGGIYSL